VSEERVLQDIWRAAGNQPDGDLATLLAQPIIGDLAGIASSSSSPQEASREALRAVARSRQASLAADIARRAVAQAASSTGAPDTEAAGRYVERVFAEATNYLMSRDLPGYVRTDTRLQTVADSLAFKENLMTETARAVQRVGLPQSFGPSEWSAFVRAVVAELERRPGR
jgi:hypothetical protein